MTNATENATVVITHMVSEAHKASYEKWLDEIVPVCKTYPGHLGVIVIRPVPGATVAFTVVVRFDTRDHLLAWMESKDRKELLEKANLLLVEGETFYVRSGLDFWFAPEGAKAALPKRWKQFLITWSAIFPLVLTAFSAVDAVLHKFAIPENRYIKILCVTFIVVALMVYVVMPRYTKLVHRWLFK